MAKSKDVPDPNKRKLWLCPDGAHNYKPTNIQLSNGAAYYEHLDIIKTEEEERYTDCVTNEAGQVEYVTKTRKVKKFRVIDSEPGKHFQTWVCCKCGDAIEVCVKSHGPLYEKAAKDPAVVEELRQRGYKGF